MIVSNDGRWASTKYRYIDSTNATTDPRDKRLIRKQPLEPPFVVLLTDPEHRAALAAARSLARAGHTILTIGPVRGIAGVSRAVRRHVPATDFSGGADATSGFLDALRLAIDSHRVDVVIPVSDAASRIILPERSRLGAAVAGPTLAAYERASDKEAVTHVASTIGLRAPSQRRLGAASELDAILPSLRWPVVVKPARSAVESGGTITRHSVTYAHTAADLSRTVLAHTATAFPLLLQERIVGDGIGVFLLRRKGQTVLHFAHRRLREKPPSGGVSTLRESFAPPADLLALCESLLDRLDYEGAAMIELKQDARTGEYVLMEINARLWGSLQLAIDAGLDFPSALVAMTLNTGRMPEQPPFRHVRTYWELGEVDHALALLRKSAAELNATDALKTGARAAVRALFDRRRSDRAEVFRWSDPRPFIAEFGRWVRRK